MSACRNNTAVPGCFVPTDGSNPVGVTIHYVYDSDGVGFATLYTTPDGAPIDAAAYLGGGTVLSGSCPVIQVDVEHVVLCDDADANAATAGVPFVRRYERRFTQAGAFVSQTVTDLALDLVTPYAPLGTITDSCASDFEFTEQILCDANNVQVVRRQTSINGVMAVIGYFNLDGTVVVPVLPLGPCPTCADEAFRGVLTSWAAVR